MLEGVVATVLNSVLSAYVDNLNTDQLNVGIWSGDVKLRGYVWPLTCVSY